jgi:hypothetical protein
MEAVYKNLTLLGTVRARMFKLAMAEASSTSGVM